MKRNTKIILSIVCIILIAIAIVIGSLISKEEKEVREVNRKPEIVFQAEKETAVIKKPVYRIKRRIAPPVSEVTEAPAIAPGMVKAKKSYDEIHRDAIRFFNYLDQRNYIKAYKLKEGTYKHFLKLMEKLSANPPIISGETEDIYILTHNIAHFYRVIGKENVSLIKDILSNEREIIEPTMGLIYDWITKGIENNRKEIKTTTKDLYEYAGFFLNTLGGKAYLLRRASRTRTLVTYYSILILDKANKEKLNRHGIDIRLPVTLLMDDIRNQKNLSSKSEYLRKLNAIKKQVKS